MSYQNEYQRSIKDPQAFWAAQGKKLDWFTPPSQTLSLNQNGMPSWFADGQMNTCYMALDTHIKAGRGDQIAIYYDSPVTDTKQSFTYTQLFEQVCLFAGALKNQGVSKGDRVLIYLPMVPQAAIAMLACARLGAIHSVVFGGFAAKELAVRIDDANPKVIVSASCGIEIDRVIAYKPLLDEAINLAEHAPQSCIILERPQCQAQLVAGRDISWSQAIDNAQPADCVSIKGEDPLYILYTSGTTGTPKGVVRENGGHAVALHYSMKAIYDMNPGDVFWAASDVGWVVGHSYVVYAPLLAGLTTIIYEGKPVFTPDAGAFWRVVNDYHVKALFTAPTAFRAIKKEDPQGELLAPYDVSCLKYLFLAGERLDPATYHWLAQLLNIPIIDHWWQTETGWAICANPAGIELHPCKAGSASLPAPGFDIKILDDNANELPANQQGNIAIKLPLPPSCLNTIWQNFPRFEQGYLSTFEGYYCSGDGGYFDEDGYLYVMGRTDDVINVAGHRLSTGEMEQVLADNLNVAEAAVIGIHCPLKGQIPLGLIILKNGIDSQEKAYQEKGCQEKEIEQQLITQVRAQVGPVASFRTVIVVKSLPKTRSGKILRKVLRQIADGQEYTVPSTIENPNSLKQIDQAMQRRKIGANQN